ncbi:hypothetical protein F4780DRAFT_789132 [Xylariomycetidae sp. FL0641]|nr:hypothetical protein F4780DRAFT_789132 [Xylariomycetidae sp. FL0641]
MPHNEKPRLEALHDREAKNRVARLGYLIRNMAGRYFGEARPAPKPWPEITGLFENMSDSYMSYLRNKPFNDSRRTFFEAAIWRGIKYHILDSPLTILDERGGKHLSDLQYRVFRDQPPTLECPGSRRWVKNFQRRRVQRGWLQQDLRASPDPKAMEDITLDMASCFKAWANVDDENILKAEFACITEEATNLAVSMTRCRAHYVFCMAETIYSDKLHSFEGEAWVESNDRLRRGGGNVKLLITPGLLRYGNADGGDYKSPVVVVKARCVRERRGRK